MRENIFRFPQTRAPRQTKQQSEGNPPFTGPAYNDSVRSASSQLVSSVPDVPGYQTKKSKKAFFTNFETVPFVL